MSRTALFLDVTVVASAAPPWPWRRRSGVRERPVPVPGLLLSGISPWAVGYLVQGRLRHRRLNE